MQPIIISKTVIMPETDISRRLDLPEGYSLVSGYNRVMAALKLGLTEIRAMDDEGNTHTLKIKNY